MKIIKFPNKLKDTWFEKAINDNCKDSKKLIINSYLNGENGFPKDHIEVRRLVKHFIFCEVAFPIWLEYLKSNETGKAALDNDPKKTLEIKQKFDDNFLKQNPSESNKNLLNEVNKGNDLACLELMIGLATGINGIEMNHNLLFDIYWSKDNKVIPKYILSFSSTNMISQDVDYEKAIDTITVCINEYRKNIIANK